MNRRDHVCSLTGLALLLLLAIASRAGAQAIYRWTDDRGIVHFGQQPPADRAAEERRMPKRPASEAEDEAVKESADESADDSEKSTVPASDEEKPSEDTGTQQSDSQVILDNNESALVGNGV